MASKQPFKNYNYEGEEVNLLRLSFSVIAKLQFPINLISMGYEGVAFVPLYFPEHLDLIPKISGIEYFEITVNRNVDNLTFVNYLDNINEVKINLHDSRFNMIDFQNRNHGWKSLSISNGYPKNIETLNLSKLHISFNSIINISVPKNLKTLSCSLNSSDLSGYPVSKSLEILILGDTKLRTLTGIEKYSKLKYLKLQRCYNLYDISAITKLNSLERIDFLMCESLDFTDLLRLSEQGIKVYEDGNDIRTIAKPKQSISPKLIDLINDNSVFNLNQFPLNKLDEFKDRHSLEIAESTEWSSQLKEYIEFHKDMLTNDLIETIDKMHSDRFLELLILNQILFIKNGDILVIFEYKIVQFTNYKLVINSNLDGNILSVTIES